jgi:hypothetical protein
MNLVRVARLVILIVLSASSVSALAKMSHASKLLKDRRLPGSKLSKAVPSALLSVGVVLPVWITALVPMAIADFILGAMKRLVIPVPTKEKLSYYHDLPNVTTRPAGALNSKSPRELDLIVYGATGFTGKLLTRYLAKTYKGTSLKWAIAGRSQARLEEVRDSLGPDWKDLKIVVADGLDADAVTSMVRRTKCVATTAGPFALHANQLLASCAVRILLYFLFLFVMIVFILSVYGSLLAFADTT